MRRLVSVLAAGAFLVGTAGTASAELLRWEGTLSLHLMRMGTMAATGGSFATVNGSASLGHLTTLSISGGITWKGSIFVSDPEVAPLNAIRGSFTLGSGALAPISGATASGGGLTQNVLPVPGDLKFCILFAACVSYIPVPLTVGGTRGVGIGGMLTVNGYGPGIQISIHGAPWTIGVASVTGLPTENGGFSTTSVIGFAHGPASGTSSTARISGAVQLVTPAKVVSTLGDGTVWPMLGVLTIHFVPEPQTFVLFASGLAALGIARRGRAKK
jgi:hypothetical protein